MLIFLNSSFVPEGDAKVSIFDRGFLYGDGVFETLRAYRGIIFHCNDHIDRLFQSANAIYITLPFTKEYFKEALYRTLQENNLRDAYLRLSVTRGESEPGLDIEGCSHPTVIIIPKAFSGYPEDRYAHGIKAAVVNTRRIPPSVLDPKIKSLNFLNNIMAKIETKDIAASEGIMLNIEGYVAEGTVSNVFIVKDGVIKTPSLSVGILNGVTRSIVIDLARGNNTLVIEQPFYPDELYTADECFITSTIAEVLPVTSIDNKQIGNGQPGEISKQLLKSFRLLTSISI